MSKSKPAPKTAARPAGRPKTGWSKRGSYRHLPDEVQAIAAIRTHLGLTTDADAVREALLSLAAMIKGGGPRG